MNPNDDDRYRFRCRRDCGGDQEERGRGPGADRQPDALPGRGRLHRRIVSRRAGAL